MYKKITLVLGALCLGLFAQAQDENDALLLGRTYQYGTARNLSLSGATGSLGADFGAINNNPAGLGQYRSSEFTFSPNVFLTNTEGDYQGISTDKSETRFNFNQAGVVFAKAKKGKAYKRSKWKTSNFSVGFNRLANLHSDYTYTGEDNQSSFVENFAEEINSAGGLYYDADGNPQIDGVVSSAAEGAFFTYIVDVSPTDSLSVESFVPYSTNLQRTKSITRRGGINELNLSYGANYDEKVLIGFSIGLPIVNYNEVEVLTEDDLSGDTDNDFEYVDLVQKVNIEGNGINLKLGTIFKPNKFFRFGVALHTPTWYSITDVSTVEFQAHTENFLGQQTAENLEANIFDYRYQSPMKAMVSATGLFGKQGFLSADVEWVNYDGMKYRYDNGFEAAELAVNNAIQNTYKNALNIRLGGEVRLDQIALRAGYGYYGSPYESYSSGATQSGSLGVGYRGKSFFLDFAAQYMFMQDPDATHTLARSVAIPTAEITTRNTQIAMTAGFKF